MGLESTLWTAESIFVLISVLTIFLNYIVDPERRRPFNWLVRAIMWLGLFTFFTGMTIAAYNLLVSLPPCQNNQCSTIQDIYNVLSILFTSFGILASALSFEKILTLIDYNYAISFARVAWIEGSKVMNLAFIFGLLSAISVTAMFALPNFFFLGLLCSGASTLVAFSENKVKR